MQKKENISTFPIKALMPFALAIFPFLILPFVLVSNFFRQEDTKIAPLAAVHIEASQASTSKIAEFLDISLPVQNLALSAQGNGLFGRTNLMFDSSVRGALKKMNLSVDHLDLWITEHPDSALKYLRYMPTATQRDVAATALFIRASNRLVDEKTAWREAAALVHYSAKYGVPLTFATAIAHSESTFNPRAISSKGAAGVMQVMWRIHNGLLESNGITGSDSLIDPEKGVAAGCLLLSRYIKAYGSLQTAMKRYYGGNSVDYNRKINRMMVRIATHHQSLP